MGNIPQTKVGSKKSRYVALVSQIIGLQEEIGKLRREMRPMVEEAVQKSLGDKYHLITSTLNDVMVQRKIFIEKGFITRDEINKKYEELKTEK